MRTTFYFIAKKYFVSFNYFRQKRFHAAVLLFAIFALTFAGKPDCEGFGNARPTNILYAVNGSVVETLVGSVAPGDEITLSFTVPAGADSTVFSLVCYKALGALPAEGLTTVFDMSSKLCGPGTHLLTVRVPETYYSLAFVKGCVNFEIGPNRCREYYAAQGRLVEEIDADFAGEMVTRKK